MGETEAKRIDVKQAVHIAIAFVKQLYESPLPGLQLEEVELSDDDQEWLVTIGFLRDDAAAYHYQTAAQSFRALSDGITTHSDRLRTYKTVVVDAETGEPKSMKIRSLATAR